MKRPTRSLRAALMAVCACAAALLAVSPIAGADDIPRPPGAVDNRGYELVAPPDANQNSTFGPIAVSDDGTAAMFNITGPLPDDSGGVYSLRKSVRTAEGWISRSMLPPLAEMPDRQYLVSAVTPDLQSVAATALNGVGLIGTTRATLLRLDGSPDGWLQTILHPFPRRFGLTGVPVVASTDLRHLFSAVPADTDPSLPGVAPGVGNLYDFGSGTPELVGINPNTGLAPACGLDSEVWDFAREGLSLQTEHWASTDGRRVFYTTSGDVCSDPLQLYVHDTGTHTSTLVSGPPVGGDPDNGVVRFLQGAANGAWAIFASATSYVAADDDDANTSDVDIYRWSAATGQSQCLTCIGVSADVYLTTGVGDLAARAAVSEDGSHVYFSSVNRLVDAPTAADTNNPNTYVWRQGHPLIRFVARASGVQSAVLNGGYVTPNGKTLLFLSNYSGLDAVTGTANGMWDQLYRYDSEDGSVRCLSCPPDGVASNSVPLALAQGLGGIVGRVRPASDDGKIVFFVSADALVAEDRNNDYDIYEWRDGVVKLITNGQTDYPRGSFPSVATTTPDGHDVFFGDLAKLTSDDTDSGMKLYDARVDGGFPPEAVPPAPCHGDCRGSATDPPSLPDPGTGGGGGDGNAVPEDPATLAVDQPTAAQRARAVRRGKLRLSVRVSAPGPIELFAQAKLGKRTRVVTDRTVRATRAGSLDVTLRLTRSVRAQLAAGRRVRLVVTVSFADALDSRRLVVVLRGSRGGGAEGAARQGHVLRSTADGR